MRHAPLKTWSINVGAGDFVLLDIFQTAKSLRSSYLENFIYCNIIWILSL